MRPAVLPAGKTPPRLLVGSPQARTRIWVEGGRPRTTALTALVPGPTPTSRRAKPSGDPGKVTSSVLSRAHAATRAQSTNAAGLTRVGTLGSKTETPRIATRS